MASGVESSRYQIVCSPYGPRTGRKPVSQDGWVGESPMASLAVVPIFVNAVPALLPAILAGAASVVAVLFKPREMIQLCRSRPEIPLGTLGGILLLTLGGVRLFGGDSTANGAAARSPA